MERDLIVVRKRNDGAGNTENHRRMNFAVGVCTAISTRVLTAQVIHPHCDHAGLLFPGVQVLHNTQTHQLRPAAFMESIL